MGVKKCSSTWTAKWEHIGEQWEQTFSCLSRKLLSATSLSTCKISCLLPESESENQKFSCLSLNFASSTVFVHLQNILPPTRKWKWKSNISCLSRKLLSATSLSTCKISCLQAPFWKVKVKINEIVFAPLPNIAPFVRLLLQKFVQLSQK